MGWEAAPAVDVQHMPFNDSHSVCGRSVVAAEPQPLPPSRMELLCFSFFFVQCCVSFFPLDSIHGKFKEVKTCCLCTALPSFSYSVNAALS